MWRDGLETVPSGLLDRRTDQIAPLGPRAVVVLHVLEPEQILEHEPRMARALADAAVRDHRPVGCHALARIERLQLLVALERPVVVAGLRPRDVLRPRDMAAALTRLGQSR